jgi:hypothetical protein
LLKLKIDVSQVEHFTAALEQFPEILHAEMQSFMAGTMAHLAGEASERTPRRTGTLANSIAAGHYVKEIPAGLGVEELPGGMLGVAATSIGYAIPVELGVKPYQATSVKGNKFTHPGQPGHFMYTNTIAANKGQIEREFPAMVTRVWSKATGGLK